MHAQGTKGPLTIGEEFRQMAMKIAYLTQYDARNIRAWSGTGFNMANCLEKAGIEIDYLGPLKYQYNPINIARYLINKYVLGKKDHPHRDPGFLRYFARQSERMLAASNADLVFAPGGFPLTYLKKDRPVVLWTDCTFANLLDYYPAWTGLSARTIRNGHDADRRALGNCDLLLFSSKWSADSAINDYGVDPAKVHVVPLGSNMPGEREPQDIERIISARLEKLESKLTLFCSGVNWHRKGVDVAVKVVEKLNAMGINTELLVAGCSPPKGEVVPQYVHLLGFISKAEPQGVAHLARLYETSHGFILPTRADCYGIVFCEAASYGLPSLASRTGGIGSAVSDGLSGCLFDPASTPQQWADRISAVVRNPSVYANLCRTTYAEYKKRLNWTASGQTIKKLLEELLAKRNYPRREDTPLQIDTTIRLESNGAVRKETV